MQAELERCWPGAAHRLRQGAVEELVAWSEVSVRAVPESAADAQCAVAGAYLADEQPPVIAIAESLSPGRRAFTALHELGHHLQQHAFDLFTALLNQPDDGRALEETSCNAFAAELLLPADLVRRHLPDEGPSARSIVALWKDPAISASRAAVCARGARLLRSPGHMLLLDPEGLVAFGDSRGLPPLARGADQPHLPLFQRAQANSSVAHTGQISIAYRDGIHGQDLYGQAMAMGRHVVLVAVTERPPWLTGQFTLPIADRGPRGRWWSCQHCGHDFETFGRCCLRCGAPTCPECARCECSAVLERTCLRCFLTLPIAAFIGDSRVCENCA